MKKFFTGLMVVCLMLQVSLPAYAAETETSVSGSDYYYEEVYAEGANALDVIQDSGVIRHFDNIRTSESLEIVGAITKRVYVRETLDENSNIIDSRLMNKEEAEQYKARNTEVGNDSTVDGYLDIYLVVYKDAQYNYSAYGTANWANGEYDSNTSESPAVGDDFIAITWGGDGELELQSESISGQYQYNQGDIDFSKAKSDSYNGYCWRFAEMKDLLLVNYFTDYVDCNVELSKTYSAYRGQKTNVSLTYIHTYQKVVGDISFSAGIGEASAGVNLSSTDADWQIQVDIPKIWF